MNSLASQESIISFWEGAGPEKWFSRDDAFDAEIRDRFMATYEAAVAGDLADWEESAPGALALLILLDQFPRNMFRGSRKVYETDALSLTIAEQAIEAGFHNAFKPPMSRFFILPLTHAEDLAAQDRAIALNEELGDADGAKWARHHRDIVAQFGRFPHRNEILGRETTAEEAAFLAESDFHG